MPLKIRKNYGFTLVELLVVISILGVLATLVIVSFGGSQKQARDTQRKSDLKQYQTVLENAATVSQLYPSETAAGGASAISVCENYLKSKCSADPRQKDDPTFEYKYQSNGSGSGTVDATRYVLWGKLENTPDYWVVCSNGQVGTVAQSAWSNPAAGTCPL